MDTEYKTVGKAASGEFTVNRSRFIGHIKPVKTEAEAVDFINQMRSEYWDATHNVYAYILREGNIRRYSDDGEPQGTAGIPVLDVLQKSGICDCCVVVTRYFGGVLLGAGGLVRAYSKSAAMAVELGGVTVMYSCVTAKLRCEYTLYGRVNGLIPAHGGRIISSDFAADVTLEFYLPREAQAEFERDLADASCGGVRAEFGEQIYVAKES